jgi:tetratricopeptide (TPR) repeat protein
MSEKKASDIIGNLRINYDRAIQAIRRDNFDYAIELLGGLLKKDPSNIDVRFSLREAARGRAGKRSGLFQKVISTAGGGHHLAKAQLALNSDPREALHEAEQMLLSDPQNVSALKISADAAIACGFTQTCLKTLAMVHNYAPGDIQANTKLANLYCDLGEPEKAEQIYQVLCKHHPNDSELLMAAKNISARRTLKRGGYEEAGEEGSFRKALKSSGEATLLEQQARGHKDEDTISHLLTEYERRFETETENIKLIKDIAELYILRKDYYRALEYFNHLSTIPNALDSAVEKAIADATVKRYDQVIAELDPTLEDYDAQKTDLEAARDGFIFESLKDRVKRYPTDMDARFDLAEGLFKRGEFGDATKEFQHVQRFPRLRRRAVLYTAKCFAARRMTDMAIKTLQKALEEKRDMDDEQKELSYTLASVLEESGRVDDAMTYYKAIYEVDVSFRDVAEKVERHYEE